MRPRRCRGRPAARTCNSQATPIVVDGVMYLPAATASSRSSRRRARKSGGIRSPAARRRGAASRYWPGEGHGRPRIIFTAGRRLIALDASDRRDCTPASAQNGEVDMGMPYNSVPLIYKNVVVVGANTPPGTPGGIGNRARVRCAHRRQAVGVQLGAAAGTGRPRHLGGRQLEGPPWRQRVAVLLHARRQRGLSLSAAGVADPRRLRRRPRRAPTCSATRSSRSTSRPAKYKWHFQTIHHDLWDADPPAPPGLFDVVRERPAHSRAGADHEVGLPLHPEPRDRPADLRRRRAPGCGERCARRAGVSARSRSR